MKTARMVPGLGILLAVMVGCETADRAATEVKPPNGVVAFKDADKIKSWDAWNDHKPKVAPKEKNSVTWLKLNQLDPGLKPLGRLAVREAKDIKASNWSIGCETMDRDYADWNAFKHLLGPLGAKRARFFSGWAKTEQEKGKYDFAWLDRQIRESAAMGVKPWVCLSYGNPVYGSDFRLGMRVKQVTDNPEAFEAWLRYCRASVKRYRDVVDEWEIWNEPFGQRAEYAELFYRTAKAIREVQPNAKCICTAISWNNDPAKNDYVGVLEKLKRENALDLGSYFVVHPYHRNPDDSYEVLNGKPGNGGVMQVRRLVKKYSGAFDILQGEVGCPSQLEYGHALCNVEWTEYSQAKWNLRRTISDAAHAIPSSVFTMVDLKYTFMLQSFGQVRMSLLKEVVYRRPSYYAMQNVFSYLDSEVHPVAWCTNVPFTVERRFDPRDSSPRRLNAAKFTRFGRPVHFCWYGDRQPSNELGFDRISLRVDGKFSNPVWVDMITGRIFAIDPKNVKAEKGTTLLSDLPMWDSPVMIADAVSAPRRYEWTKEKPFDIVDSFYRPGDFTSRMKAFPGPHTNAPWLKMPTKDFLPCIDRYGQFRHRDWPGKTKTDGDLKRAAADEAKELSVYPGPLDRNEYGGWANGPQLKATGRFRAEKYNGKWWLVDPEGRLFWSFGPVRVTPSSAMTPMNGDPVSGRRGVALPDRDCFFAELPPEPGKPGENAFSKFWTTHDDLLFPFYGNRGETRIYDLSSANLYRKYGEGYYEKFADLAHRRLRSWGCNTIANSSDVKICLMDRTPYAERVECQSRPIAGSHGHWWKFRDPWDESFAKGVTAALEAHGREAHDKWCIGFFVDNEINWGASARQLAAWTLQSPADQPAKVEFVKRLGAKYGEVSKLNAAWKTSYADWDDLLHSVFAPGDAATPDLEEFTAVICDEYFRRTRETVKAFDAGLMYLGCRFAGSARPWAIAACARHCDVVSYNIYDTSIAAWRLPQNLDAPVMIGEFHFGATDRGLFGTGVQVAKNQAERAVKLTAYVKSALENPQIVGVHWHQFSDQATTGRFDGEYLQVGWTDVCDTPYPETIAAVRAVAYPLYALRAAGECRTDQMANTGDYRMPDSAIVVQDVRGYNSWPMIQAMKDRIVCSYSRDNALPKDGHTIHPGSRDSYAKVSFDGGRTWSAETTIAADSKVGEVNEGIGLDSTGAVLAWVRCWGGKDRRRHELYRSADGFKFEKICSLQPEPFPMQVMDPVAVPELGIVSPWFAGDYRKGGSNSWGILVSKDDGKTWEQRKIEDGLSVKEWVTEPSIVSLGGGRLLIVGRCEQGLGNQFQVTSVDGGKTWRKHRTNIGDVKESTPSLIYDPRTDLVANYYYHRGARMLKRRVAKAAFIFDHPDQWPEPEVLAKGFEQRAYDAGNVKATRYQEKVDCCAWYTGSQSNASVVVTLVKPPAGS